MTARTDESFLAVILFILDCFCFDTQKICKAEMLALIGVNICLCKKNRLTLQSK